MAENIVLKNRDILSQQNYVIKADPNCNYWIGFTRTKLEKYLKEFGENFNLIVAGSPDGEGDFFVIPYAKLKHILVNDFLSNRKEGRLRWIGNINNYQIKMNNCDDLINVIDFYGNPKLIGYSSDIKNVLKEKPPLSEDEKNEYAIQNRIREIEVRQKQSIFRKNVLDNFENKCCITGITEPELLIASHIVPWSKRIDSRLDPANGLCLSVLYDKLFDRGFITFEDDLRVRTTSEKNISSEALQSILLSMQDSTVKAKKPVNYQIKTEYLEYHRDVVFLK